MTVLGNIIKGVRPVIRVEDNQMVVLINTDNPIILYYALNHFDELAIANKKSAIIIGTSLNLECVLPRIKTECHIVKLTSKQILKQHAYSSLHKNWFGEYTGTTKTSFREIADYDSSGYKISNHINNHIFDPEYEICERLLLIPKPELRGFNIDEFNKFKEALGW